MQPRHGTTPHPISLPCTYAAFGCIQAVARASPKPKATAPKRQLRHMADCGKSKRDGEKGTKEEKRVSHGGGGGGENGCREPIMHVCMYRLCACTQWSVNGEARTVCCASPVWRMVLPCCLFFSFPIIRLHLPTRLAFPASTPPLVQSADADADAKGKRDCCAPHHGLGRISYSSLAMY